jgi:hypothetical protein
MCRADAPPIHLKNRRTFALFTTIAAMKAFLAKNLRYKEFENLLLKASVPTELRSPRNYDSKLDLLNRAVDALLLSGRTDVLDTCLITHSLTDSVKPMGYKTGSASLQRSIFGQSSCSNV